MKIAYIKHNFKRYQKDLIAKANVIIEEYQNAGYRLSLRQLYYQFVSRDFLANNLANYRALGFVISNARLAGLIDWDAIEDRGRELRGRNKWGTPGEYVSQLADGYHTDWWKDQDKVPEIWIEKDALLGVFERVCTKHDVDFFSCRGYNSQTAMHEAARRISRREQETVILHFGDHDPSGIDMTRDIEDRLNVFGVDNFRIKRCALNIDQVRKYKCPPNPAKETDARFKDYVSEHGKKCWELDALDVRVLSDLAKTNIEKLITNKSAYKRAQEAEEDGQQEITDAAESLG